MLTANGMNEIDQHDAESSDSLKSMPKDLLAEVWNSIAEQDAFIKVVEQLERDVNDQLTEGVENREFTVADIASAFSGREEQGIKLTDQGVSLDPIMSVGVGSTNLLAMMHAEVELAFAELLAVSVSNSANPAGPVFAEEDQPNKDAQVGMLLEVVASLLGSLEYRNKSVLSGNSSEQSLEEQRIAHSIDQLTTAMVTLAEVVSGTNADDNMDISDISQTSAGNTDTSEHIV